MISMKVMTDTDTRAVMMIMMIRTKVMVMIMMGIIVTAFGQDGLDAEQISLNKAIIF